MAIVINQNWEENKKNTNNYERSKYIPPFNSNEKEPDELLTTSFEASWSSSSILSSFSTVISLTASSTLTVAMESSSVCFNEI